MYLELDEQQQALKEMAGALLAEASPIERLRGDDPGPRREAWTALAQSGLTGLCIDEADGGSGGTEVEAAVLIEEAGRAAVPEPVREAAGLAAPLLAAHADEAQRERFLRPLAAGEQIVGAAVGPKRALAASSLCDAALVIDDGQVKVVAIADLELQPVAAADPGRDLAYVTGVRAGDEAVLGGASVADYETRARAATAAALVGLAQRLVDTAVEHAKVREQFKTPIGAFQAVAHPLVDGHIGVETARVASWYAALRLADGAADAARAAEVAKAAADDAADRADHVALQTLGGIGFTWEHDLHLLSKRVTAYRAEPAPTRDDRRALGRALLAG